MYIYEESFFYTKILKCEKADVQNLLVNKKEYYTYFSIPKKDGLREIAAVKKDSQLYHVQVRLKNYLSGLPMPEVAKGFIKGSSYFDFLLPHLNKRFFLHIDIKDFFGSIKKEQIIKALKCCCDVDDCINAMADLCTLDGKLPQGAVTSPVLSNIVFARTDQRIMKYCQALAICHIDGKQCLNDVVYTRYADDLLFSSNYLDFKDKKNFLNTVKKILVENCFQINQSKTKYGENQIVLSGYVVGKNIHLSRKKMSDLNCILHYFDAREQMEHTKYKVDVDKLKDEKELIQKMNDECQRENEEQFRTIKDILNYLCGYRAFLIAVDKVNSSKDSNILQNRNRIKKIEKIVDKLAQRYSV